MLLLKNKKATHEYAIEKTFTAGVVLSGPEVKSLRRKVLVRKKEISQLAGALDQKGRALVPLSFELLGNKIKLRFGIGKGLKLHDKRAKLKKKTIQRDIDRAIKNQY